MYTHTSAIVRLNTVCTKIYSTEMKRNNITLLSSVSLILLKETNMQIISVLIYHGMHNVSVQNVHRLAVDSVHIVHADSQTYPRTKVAADSCKRR
jgi:hypothetical protein